MTRTGWAYVRVLVKEANGISWCEHRIGNLFSIPSEDTPSDIS